MTIVTRKQLIKFLKVVDESFPVPISQKVDLIDYADKLLQKATLCAEIVDGDLAGLVAGYTDNLPDGIAYIALVGVIPEAQHKGIASKLIKKFGEECKKKNIKKVHLYTDKRNKKAIQMYKKLGFEKYVIQKEERPDDVHLILNIFE